MMQLRQILEKHPIFKGMESNYLETIARVSELKTWEEGDFIFRRGDSAESVYLLLRGEVLLELASAGEGEMTVQRLKPGDVLGCSWLLTPHCWQLDARAAGKVEGVLINAAYLRAKCEEDHDFGYEFMKRFSLCLIRRLQDFRKQMLESYKTLSE